MPLLHQPVAQARLSQHASKRHSLMKKIKIYPQPSQLQNALKSSQHLKHLCQLCTTKYFAPYQAGFFLWTEFNLCFTCDLYPALVPDLQPPLGEQGAEVEGMKVGAFKPSRQAGPSHSVWYHHHAPLMIIFLEGCDQRCVPSPEPVHADKQFCSGFTS